MRTEDEYSMQQQSMPSQYPEEVIRPGRFTLFLHGIKTLKLIAALSQDRRIPLSRKILFFGSILFLLVLLFFPDVFGDAFLGVVLPVVGLVLGVPIDAGFDWVMFAIVLVSLLKVFPAELVSEHYQRVFKKV
jgi:hypothetical protein